MMGWLVLAVVVSVFVSVAWLFVGYQLHWPAWVAVVFSMISGVAIGVSFGLLAMRS